LRQVASGDYALSHARSHLGAVPALAGLAARRVPFLFDTRGRWIDERLEEGKWFTNPAALRMARALEHQMFRAAKAVVTLTELEADDVRGGAFGPAGNRPIMTIPTCADYDEFQIRRPDVWHFVPSDLRARLEGRLVIGFVGAMNRSYLSEEAARLARLVLDRRPEAFVLAVSGQRKEYSDLFARHGIAPDRSLIQPVEHRAMPEWLSLVRWGLLLLDSPNAKRGSMPTKLAEFFAAGVRPLQHGCNTEVSDWVRIAGSGHVLPNVNEAELTRAAEFVCSAPEVDAELLLAARKRTEGHFSLTGGIERYVDILRRVMP
jgi:glycosyltransferase involved in cell wall biosynthesis